jgi:hypothetical protein
MLVMLRMNHGFMELHEENLKEKHPCRNSRPLIPKFATMDSMLLWTMRKREKMRRSEV